VIRRLHPTLLQGDITKNNYFEGWFQKIFVPKKNTSIVLIYGIATGNELTKTGFIQLFVPGHEVIHMDFPQHEITLSKRKHEVNFGLNYFSSNRIHIEDKRVELDVEIIPQATKALKKNSMGNFYLVPGLPCYHSVLQINSSVKGIVKINNELIHFDRSTGYLEKNWGSSFPEKYFWMHAQDPLNATNQVLYSQAEIKWRNKTFIKHVGFIQLNGKSIDLRKIRRKHIVCHVSNSNQLEISIDPIGIALNFDLGDANNTSFNSPREGKMTNKIIHNIDVPVILKITSKSLNNNTLLNGNIENSIF
jgi:hypothetical protein